MVKCSSCAIVEPSEDNHVCKSLAECFEDDKYSDMESLEDFCVTCQIKRPQRSKHCKFLDKCVFEYDHHCFFLSKTIGKNNRKVMFFGLLASFLAVFFFLVLCWAEINSAIEKYEHFSTYCVTFAVHFYYKNGLFKVIAGVSMIVAWYNWWYLFIEIYSISYGLTVNEVVNRHKYRYLFSPYLALDDTIRMQFVNPFNKGIANNWLEFLGS